MDKNKTGGLAQKTPASKRTRIAAASAPAKATRKRRTERPALVKKLHLPDNGSGSDTEVQEQGERPGEGTERDHGTTGPGIPAGASRSADRSQDRPGNPGPGIRLQNSTGTNTGKQKEP